MWQAHGWDRSDRVLRGDRRGGGGGHLHPPSRPVADLSGGKGRPAMTTDSYGLRLHSTTPPLVGAYDIDKHFAGVTALRNVTVKSLRQPKTQVLTTPR